MKWDLDLWYEMWDRAGSQGLDIWYPVQGGPEAEGELGSVPDAGVVDPSVPPVDAGGRPE